MTVFKWEAFVGVVKPTLTGCGGNRNEYSRQLQLWLKANVPGYIEKARRVAHACDRARMERDPEYRKKVTTYRNITAKAAGHRNDKRDNYKGGKIPNAPPWLTIAHKREMRALYSLAIDATADTGVRHHVDHIYPIVGLNELGEHISCGLHVPWNLQIVTAKDNRRKWRQNPKDIP